MAVQMLTAHENGTVTSVDNTWTDCAVISAGSFIANQKYLIIGLGVIQMQAGAAEHHIRIAHGTTPTVFTDGEAVLDPGIGGADGRGLFQYMTVFTQPATAERVIIQILREGATGNVTSGFTTVLAINLTDLTENTDYFFNEVTADYTTTTTPTAQAAVTFTPNGTDDYWVIGNVVESLPANTTDGTDFRCELFESVGATTTPLVDVEGEDIDAGDETRIFCLQRVWTALSAAAHTFSLRPYHAGGTFQVDSTRIFALRLNKFSQHAVVNNTATDTPSTTPTWETEATVSFTPGVTGNWFYLGGAMASNSGADATSAAMRLQHNNSGSFVSEPAYGDDEPNQSPAWDITDLIAQYMGNVRSFTSGASRTINFDFTSLANAPDVRDRCLVAFSAELPSLNLPDGQQNVTGRLYKQKTIDFLAGFWCDLLITTLFRQDQMVGGKRDLPDYFYRLYSLKQHREYMGHGVYSFPLSLIGQDLIIVRNYLDLNLPIPVRSLRVPMRTLFRNELLLNTLLSQDKLPARTEYGMKVSRL